MSLRLRSALVTFAILAVAGAWACTQSSNPVSPSSAGGSTAAKPGGSSAYQLNLSHIACIGTTGNVEIHFVLLQVPDGITPGSLSFSINGVPQTPVAPGPRTGNVWHYSATVPAGVIDVTSASVDVPAGSGGYLARTVQLHNPSAYAGEYLCRSTPSCQLSLPVSENLCLAPSDLGSPEAECAFFGLVVLGKDDGLSGTTHNASMDADFAIVKDGKGSCVGAGLNSYRTYVGVEAGDPLLTPLGGGDISHVTYCGCPTLPQ